MTSPPTPNTHQVSQGVSIWVCWKTCEDKGAALQPGARGSRLVVQGIEQDSTIPGATELYDQTH